MLDGLQWGPPPSQVAQLTLRGNRVYTISLSTSSGQSFPDQHRNRSSGSFGLGTEDWENDYLLSKCFQLSPLLIFVDIFHLAPYYSSAHILMLFFLTIIVGMISFFLYQPFQLLLVSPVCCTVSFFWNLFLFSFFDKGIVFFYILHSKVIADLHNALGYSWHWYKKGKNPNETEKRSVICN